MASRGLPDDGIVYTLAIDPVTPTTLYAGTYDGVFDIEQVGSCTRDCDRTGIVTISEIIRLVNIALGNAELSACSDGIPSGAAVDIALLMEAVNNALSGCGSG